MDQDNAALAIKTLIEDNSSTLTDGLEQNEIEKSIQFVSKTWLSVPTGYPAILIRVAQARERSYSGLKNTNAGGSPYVSEYEMIIAVADEALFDSTDENFGDLAHQNFRKLCDRLVKLFRRDTEWFPSATASPRYRLPVDNRRVDLVNLEPMPLEAGYLLGAEISFTMFGCDD